MKNTVEEGQVWIGTHSLEAVEVAGAASTFVLHRDRNSRVVTEIAPLKDRPVMARLSSVLGTPAFSISGLRVIFVEGEADKGERQRFFRLFGTEGNEKSYRFIPAGDAREVIRKLEALRQVANESEQDLHLGGIIDRDFKSNPRLAEIQKEAEVLVLPFHEIENVFLFPPAIRVLLQRSGGDPGMAHKAIMDAVDRHAGAWVWLKATANNQFRDMSQLRDTKGAAWRMTWQNIEPDPKSATDRILSCLDSVSDKEGLRRALMEAIDAYRDCRGADDFWRTCMGKEAMRSLSTILGFRTADVFESHILTLWEKEEVGRPSELQEVQAYMESL